MKETRSQPLALGYIRVSTTEQADKGASLDAQRAALVAEAGRRGWDLEVVADEGVSGKTLNRPALVFCQIFLSRMCRKTEPPARLNLSHMRSPASSSALC